MSHNALARKASYTNRQGWLYWLIIIIIIIIIRQFVRRRNMSVKSLATRAPRRFEIDWDVSSQTCIEAMQLAHCDISTVVIYSSFSITKQLHIQTSCARGDTICIRLRKLTISSHLFARWHLFQHVGYFRHQQQVDLWPFDLLTLKVVSESRVTWATSEPILVFLYI